MDSMTEMMTSEFMTLFRETFETADGLYLETETSIFETIKDLPYEEASKCTAAGKETLAGHIFHTIFYIKVLKDYIAGFSMDKIDWDESWAVTEITREEWESLKKDIEKEYKELMKYIQSIKDWSNEDLFGGLLSILAHCSYHLGAIRQNIS